MSFIDDHPNYQTYQSSTYTLDMIPSEVFSALQGIIVSAVNKSGNPTNYIKHILSLMAQNIPCPQSEAWSYSFLMDDLPDFTDKLSKAKFTRQMNFFLELAQLDHINLSDLNEQFSDYNFGYILENVKIGEYTSTAVEWILCDDVTSRTEEIEKTIETVQSICQQTYDHLIQAQEQFFQTNNLSDRDIKDIVRDCLSAMETIVKKVSGKDDIKDAIQALRSDPNKWGRTEIVKDGLSLWDRMHNFYPDMRHGNPVASTLPLDEALYWIDRINSYIRFIMRMHLKNS